MNELHMGLYSDDPEEDRMWEFAEYPTCEYIGPAYYEDPDPDYCGEPLPPVAQLKPPVLGSSRPPVLGSLSYGDGRPLLKDCPLFDGGKA